MNRRVDETGEREVRAATEGGAVVVYQAFSSAIVDAALVAGTFVEPFRRGRMTWIKPSFLWMAYRSGWARKADQERVVAVRITRAGLEWALSHACLSSYDAGVHGSHDEWKAQLREAPVRVQWHPDRDLHLRPVGRRAVQIGLQGEAVDRYLDEWIVGIADVTELMHAVAGHLVNGDLESARGLLPTERVIDVDGPIRAQLGMAGSTVAPVQRE